MIAIQKLKIEDISQVEDLLCDTYIDTYGNYISKETIQKLIWNLHSTKILVSQAMNSDFFFAVAKEESSKIIGIVTLGRIDDKTAILYRLYVHPKYQRQGIGTELLSESAKALPGIEKIKLEVGEKNYKGYSFYIKQGFTEIAKKEIKIDNEIISVIIMEKNCKTRLQGRILFRLFKHLILPEKNFNQGSRIIKLPSPQTDKGRPLMQTLKDRKSQREFSTKELPLQILSDMLWAANGINRPESGKRTAPSPRNVQEIDVYIAKAGGLYLYDASKHALILVLAKDIRAKTGKAQYINLCKNIQSFVSMTSVNLIYVADFSRMKMSVNKKYFCAATDTGFISQNVYLYCASEGLATVVRDWIDIPTLEKTMQLRPEQKVIMAQSVGYPKGYED